MWAKMIWICACVVPYLHWLIWIGTFSGAPSSWEEKDIFLWISMAVLGFPSVPVFFYVAGLVQIVLEHVGIAFSNILLANTTIWLVAVIVGYLQWFHILPAIKRFWMLRRGGENR